MNDTCEVCGNIYDKMMTITVDTNKHTFDCFECAIHALAPTCHHCGVRIVGHGMEAAGQFFCCASCARSLGRHQFVDRSQEGRFDQ